MYHNFCLLFRFSAAKLGNNRNGRFYFLVDGERVAYVDKHLPNLDPSAQGSATVNLYLTAGQVVQLENVGVSVIYGASRGYAMSWFTGFMLYADQ